MRKQKTVKRTASIILLALALVATSLGAWASPLAQEPQFEPMVPCGDSASCSMAGDAFSVENSGTGAAIYGRNTSAVSGSGVYGRSNQGAGVRAQSNSNNGLFATSYNTAGIRGKSTWGVGVRAESDHNAGLWAQGYVLGTDLILAGDNSTFSDGIISSDPDYSSSNMWLLGYDDVNIILDSDDDEAGLFQIYDKWAAGQVILQVNEEGDLYIDDDLYMARAGSGGSIYATSADSASMFFYSNDDIFAHLDNNNEAEAGCFQILDGANNVIWQECEAKGMTSVGSQAVTVDTNSGTREMYAMGSPELWFEDFGSATLVDGQAMVTIDALFAETVNLDDEYHVFLTPVSSEAVLLFVTAKTPTAFEVQGVTLDGSPASASFDYRIVAKRLGYEDQRLEQADLAPAEEEAP